MDHCEAHLIDQLNKVQYLDVFFINIGLGNFYFVQIFTSSWTVPLLTEWKSLYQYQMQSVHTFVLDNTSVEGNSGYCTSV